ncbi:MAG: flagellar hook protein FlgE [Deltaproteobacteria bacterium]|nr:flagellar hook protein FlgE [Deltaproteobacteria bacterium]
MSVFQALFAGVNGIGANGTVTAIIGDNIANVNTTGFKSARAEFEDILAGGGLASGLGSRVSGTTTQYAQGGFESTTSVTDLAIDGEGFFPVKDTADGTTYYTRAGQFFIDKDGYMVNQQGLRLQGFGVDSSGNVSTTADDFQFTFEPVSPSATTTIDVAANLNSNSTPPAAFDVSDPVATSNFAAGITVYDSIGNSHLVTVYFRKQSTTNNNWSWYAVVDGDDITGATAAQIEAQGILTFDNNGALTAEVVSATDFDFQGATQSQSILFDFGSVTSTGSGVDGMTQFGTTSSLNDISQDGYTSGNLTTLEVSGDGTISGNYTNGTTQTLGQISLALFQNNQGLARVGGNAYEETIQSGVPLVDAAEAGGRGTVLSKTLEQSNVDLANELIKMVIIQRGFQANTRTISVVNELLGSLVNLGN